MEPLVILNSRSGFTLIEFCVAVVIMMVGLLGLLQAVNMASYHNLGSLLRNEAISLADQQMAIAKANVIDQGTFDSLVTSATLVQRKTRLGFGNYSAIQAVTTISANSKEVDIRVSWRYKNNKFNQTLSSLITNPAMP